MRRQCPTDVLCYGPVPQGAFLERLGIGLRKEALLRSCPKEEVRRDIESGYEMLTDGDQMGRRFKFMAVYPATMREIHEKCPPAGFQ